LVFWKVLFGPWREFLQLVGGAGMEFRFVELSFNGFFLFAKICDRFFDLHFDALFGLIDSFVFNCFAGFLGVGFIGFVGGGMLGFGFVWAVVVARFVAVGCGFVFGVEALLLDVGFAGEDFVEAVLGL
jgi:hypothetical protein